MCEVHLLCSLLDTKNFEKINIVSLKLFKKVELSMNLKNMMEQITSAVNLTKNNVELFEGASKECSKNLRKLNSALMKTIALRIKWPMQHVF